ncbi:hypothetical protein FB451DRAFT_1050885 [Mycena latifolia]|nr:hypothetical protein FB451DRAFT_1050885 [Mycena latifolia]
MATLLLLKAEFEVLTSTILRMTFAGATEAHLLAAQIGAAGVSFTLAPARPYPESWDYRRVYVLTGPPLSQKTAVIILVQHGVTLALGVHSEYDARFELAWVRHALRPSTPLTIRARPRWTQTALSTTNVDTALGLDGEDLVVYQRDGLFDLES